MDEMSGDLESRFKKAVWLIRNGPKQDSSNETKLNFYKYFKQVSRLPQTSEYWQSKYNTSSSV